MKFPLDTDDIEIVIRNNSYNYDINQSIKLFLEHYNIKDYQLGWSSPLDVGRRDDVCPVKDLSEGEIALLKRGIFRHGDPSIMVTDPESIMVLKLAWDGRR